MITLGKVIGAIAVIVLALWFASGSGNDNSVFGD